jgi:DNA polymerase-1
MQRKKIFLIDISSFIFRAFFAIRLLTNSKGQPVNAVYGVMSMLLKLIEEHKPEAMVCVFDTSAPSFRKEIFHDYKANRGEPPEDLKPQFSLIEKAVDALAIKRIAISGFEADDIIATLVKKFKDFEVVIVTGDKDLMQLVNEHVFILDTMKDVLYTPEAVKNKMGVEPKQIPDLLGLMGDASDNIPGVKGVGAKTAVELIEKFGSIENLYENINELKEGKRKETILENKENAFLSKKLATVNSNLFELVQDIDFNSIKYNFKVDDKLISFLKEMEFKQLLKKIAPTIDDVQNQLKNKLKFSILKV